MNPERWRQINDIFHAALDQDPEAREAFLQDACRGDEGLLSEVSSLIDAHGEASLLDHPAYEVAPALLGEDDGDPVLGSTVGPYRVISTLGRGGMGVVYLGEDTRLRRPVAIKALPDALTADDRFRARLRHEAMTTANLSHPGIATVYALEEFDRQLYLVREYVAGQTLRVLMTEGPASLETLLGVATDIAAALEAAHAGGVIHRDLKPENVMRTPRGQVKVLDFGLARFEHVEPVAAEVGVGLTRAGAVVGTPGYMSPEQLRGDPVDFRTDHFSFGIVVYELLTGRHPFGGGDDTAALARVLTGEPAPVRDGRPDCPDGVAAIVGRCLAKDAPDRYESTHALVADLEQARQRLTLGTAVGAGPSELASSGEVSTPETPGLRWWRIHQVVMSVIATFSLLPLWGVRHYANDPWEDVVFLAGVAAAGWIDHLRLHLFFTSRIYPEELDLQRRRTARPRFWADLFLATVLVVASGLIVASEVTPPDGFVSPGLYAAVPLIFAVAIGTIGRVIEPATTRAAFARVPTGARP